MPELIRFADELLRLYTIVLIAAVIVQILVQTNAIPYSPFMRSLHTGLSAVTEPVLKPIRRRMPATGGVDFSPLIVFVIIWFLRDVVLTNISKAAV
jgi:YggT family protein